MPRDPLLLDTDIVSLTSRDRPPPGLVEWLSAFGRYELAICFPVIAEILRGVHLLRRNNESRAEEILSWVEEIRKSEMKMLEMTWEVAEIYGLLTSTRRLKHLWVPSPSAKHDGVGHDLMVAAVAIAHRTPIISVNTSDFLEIHQVLALPGLFHPLKHIWIIRPARAIDMPARNHELAATICA